MSVGPSGNGDPDVVVEMDTAPLMMLIVTIPIQTHAVKLDLPAGNPPPTNPPPMVVAVDMNFAVTIF
jgi:biopolymer transport protein ExbD